MKNEKPEASVIDVCSFRLGELDLMPNIHKHYTLYYDETCMGSSIPRIFGTAEGWGECTARRRRAADRSALLRPVKQTAIQPRHLSAVFQGSVKQSLSLSRAHKKYAVQLPVF